MMGRTLGAKDTRPRKKRVWPMDDNLVSFPGLLRKRTYCDGIKRIMDKAIQGNHEADLYEVMMMFKRLKNL